MKNINKIVGLCALTLAAAHNANADEIYLKGGLFGVGGGYSYSLNDNFGVRAEYTNFSKDFKDESSGDFDFDASFKSKHKSVYVDYFPFAGSFRLTAGLSKRNFGADVKGSADTQNGITIGNRHLNAAEINQYKTALNLGDDFVASGDVSWKKTAPYFGFGFGHGSGKGLGFVFDFGVYLGKPTVNLKANKNLYEALDMSLKYEEIEPKLKEAANTNNPGLIGLTAADLPALKDAVDNKNYGYIKGLDIYKNAQASAQQEIDAQIAKIDDDVKNIKIIPALHFGLSYRF